MRQACVRYASIALIAVPLSACDDLVYVPGEIEARNRYEAVAVGTREADLRARLGVPECLVALSGDPAGTIELRCPESGPAKIGDEETIRSGSPTWIAVMPLPEPGTRLLVYVDGTVYGYFTVDAAGVVTKVEAIVS
jgi:hypothetical protein